MFRQVNAFIIKPFLYILNNFLAICGALTTTDAKWSITKKAIVVFSRFTWELPQVCMGFLLCFIINLGGEISHLEFHQGRIVVYSTALKTNSGISLGNFLVVGSNSNQTIVSHEFGHSIQSQYTGWFYIIIIGIPSFLRASFFKLMWSMNYFKSVNYESVWFEKQATELGKKHIREMEA